MRLIILAMLLLVASDVFADRLGSLRSNADVLLTTQAVSGLSPGSTNYIQNTTTPQIPSAFSVDTGTVNGPLRVKTIVTNGSLNVFSITGISGNLNQGVIDIFKNDAVYGAADPMFSVGSIQQVDQFTVKDQYPLYLGVYGALLGAVSAGIPSSPNMVASRNSIDQHVDFWNSGNMLIETGFPSDGGKDIIFRPQNVEALRMTPTSGILVTSSMTLTNASGLGVKYGVIVGSITINTGGSSGQTVCWKTATTLGYCSTTVGAGGACTCN